VPRSTKSLLVLSVIGTAIAVALTVFYLFAFPAKAAGSPSSAGAQRVLQSVQLPVDQRLINVSWRCEPGGCQPWFLMRTMKRGERAEKHTLVSPGHALILVSESHEAGVWQTRNVGNIGMPSGLRLVSVEWRCQPGTECELWLDVRPARAGEEAFGYTFTDSRTHWFITEQP